MCVRPRVHDLRQITARGRSGSNGKSRYGSREQGFISARDVLERGWAGNQRGTSIANDLSDVLTAV